MLDTVIVTEKYGRCLITGEIPLTKNRRYIHTIYNVITKDGDDITIHVYKNGKLTSQSVDKDYWRIERKDIILEQCTILDNLKFSKYISKIKKDPMGLEE